MKKVLLIIVALIFLICFQTVYANGFEISVESKTADAGQTVSVDLTLSDNPGIIAARFDLTYDKERLELVKAEDKKLLSGAVFSQTYRSYPYVMLWNSATTKNFTSDGVLATLTFKVADNAKSGNAFINLSSGAGNIFDVNLKDVDIRINNGSINVINESEPEAETDNNDTVTDNESADMDWAGTDSDTDNISEGKNDKNTSSPAGNKSTASVTSKPQDTTSAPADTKTESGTDTNPVDNVVSFDDVNDSEWYYDVIADVVKKKLMNGVSATHFAPDNLLTRGMLVTILYRNEGEPKMDIPLSFADVKKDDYYANAVSWAEQCGIVYGVTDDEFSPDSNITREQIATIIHRYAKYKGCDTNTSETTNILSYDDFDKISEYAIKAMQYAVGIGLINGKTENTLNPVEFATRAEAAAILCRFSNNNIRASLKIPVI